MTRDGADGCRPPGPDFSSIIYAEQAASVTDQIAHTYVSVRDAGSPRLRAKGPRIFGTRVPRRHKTCDALAST